MNELRFLPTNPFVTRNVRPGAIAFRFPEDVSAEQLMERLRANRWWGAILGPHGAGKSSLLASLEPALRDAGRALVSVALHDGERRLPRALADSGSWTPATQVVVDGYEQLSCLCRARLKRRCRRAQCGLLVTAHHDAGLPVLIEVATDLQTVQQIAADLLCGAPGVITPDDVAARFLARQGNVRETLFDLYDLYEERRT